MAMRAPCAVVTRTRVWLSPAKANPHEGNGTSISPCGKGELVDGRAGTLRGRNPDQGGTNGATPRPHLN